MEDTMLELVKICRQKEFLCIHDNVDDLIESAQQPADRGNRNIQSLQNFRVVHKSSISLNNTSQISLIHAVATILSTKEHEHSSSIGYKNSNTTPETESDEIIKYGVEELVPILSENEVTLNDKREYIEYVKALLHDPEIVSGEEENVVQHDVEEEEVDLEDISQIQDVVLHEKRLSITHLISNIESLNDNPTPDRIEPDQERLNYVMKNDIPDDSSNDPLLEEADLFLAFDNSIPPGIEKFADDSEGDICFLEELLIDDSILSHESSDSNFEDNPSVPRPPLEPPNAETDAGEEIPVVMNDKDEFDEDYHFFMIDKVFSLLSAESEDTIFDPGISV
nr:hypothetical protein [Tanacetum cinerariifolium]